MRQACDTEEEITRTSFVQRQKNPRCVRVKSGKFLVSLESSWIVWRVTGHSGKFPDSLESLPTRKLRLFRAQLLSSVDN